MKVKKSRFHPRRFAASPLVVVVGWHPWLGPQIPWLLVNIERWENHGKTMENYGNQPFSIRKLWKNYGKRWKSAIFNGETMEKLCKSMEIICFQSGNYGKTMENHGNHHTFNGKIHHFYGHVHPCSIATVDGRNPAPVDCLYHYL